MKKHSTRKHRKSKKSSSSKSLEKKIKHVVKKVLDQKIEDKYITEYVNYTTLGTQGANNATTILLLQPLLVNQSTHSGLYNPNTDCYGILGTQIRLKTIELNIQLFQSAIALANYQECLIRMMLVWDNQPASTTALVVYGVGSNYDDIILNNNQILAPLYGVNRWNKSPRFTVVFDKLVVLDSNGSKKQYRMTIPMNDKLLKFTASTTTGAYEFNHRLKLYMFWDSNSPAVLTAPNYTYDMRTTFEDA